MFFFFEFNQFVRHNLSPALTPLPFLERGRG
jgi:hypothetical protein